MEEIIFIFIGIATGFVTGFTGASGVMLLIPVLVIFFGHSVHRAIGTSLLVDVFAALTISSVYLNKGHVKIRQGITLALWAVIGSQIGAANVVLLPAELLAIALSLFMIIMGAKMYLQGINKTEHDNTKFDAWMPTHPLRRFAILSLIGLLLGVMTGLFGAGGGLIVFLVLYFIMKLPLKDAIGTSTFMMAIIALSGALGHFLHGSVDITEGALIGVGAILGGILSANIANVISEKKLAKIIGLIFILMAGALLYIQIFGN